MELQLSRMTHQNSMLERHCSDQRVLYQKEKKKKQRLKEKIKQMKVSNTRQTINAFVSQYRIYRVQHMTIT